MYLCCTCLLNIESVDVSAVVAETMVRTAAAAAEFDSLWLLLMLMLAEVMRKGNVLHTLIVDNVNVKHMNNVDMQLLSCKNISTLKKIRGGKKNKTKSFLRCLLG